MVWTEKPEAQVTRAGRLCQLKGPAGEGQSAAPARKSDICNHSQLFAAIRSTLDTEYVARAHSRTSYRCAVDIISVVSGGALVLFKKTYELGLWKRVQVSRPPSKPNLIDDIR